MTKSSALLLLLAAALQGAAAQTVPVKWVAIGCAKTDKNGALKKTGCGNGWNGGAVSSVGLLGDGSVEFQCATNQHAMLGFGASNDHNSYTDIDCAVYCDKGVFRVYELGRHSYNGPRFSPNDKLRVSRIGSQIHYYRNNKKMRTCRYKLVGPLFVDTSLYHGNGQGINSARWVYSKGKSRKVVPIQWTKIKCVSQAKGAGNLQKTACGTGWNGGAISKYGRSKNTEIQFTCTTNQYHMIGFAKGDSHQSYTDIDCATYLRRRRNARVRVGCAPLPRPALHRPDRLQDGPPRNLHRLLHAGERENHLQEASHLR
jgi:hypothetical protein